MVANAVVEEKRSATFSVRVSGDGPRYQCYHNDEPIPGATRYICTIPSASGPDQGTYDVRVENIFSRLESDRATLTVILDTKAPTVLGADGSAAATQIVLEFSEPLQALGATNSANYILTNMLGGLVPVLEAQLLDPSTVRLTTETRADGQNHLVLVSNLRDISG